MGQKRVALQSDAQRPSRQVPVSHSASRVHASPKAESSGAQAPGEPTHSPLGHSAAAVQAAPQKPPASPCPQRPAPQSSSTLQ
jgi:hypothetical protein